MSPGALRDDVSYRFIVVDLRIIVVEAQLQFVSGRKGSEIFVPSTSEMR